MNYTVILEEDDAGNLILPIPPELGWLEGDVVDFTIEGEKVILTNITAQNRVKDK